MGAEGLDVIIAGRRAYNVEGTEAAREKVVAEKVGHETA